MRLMILLLALNLVAVPARADLREFTFRQDGLDRNFLLYTPRSLARGSEPAPLVLVLHGGGGTSRQILRGTKKRFNQLADEHRFYVAYPNAVDKVWDFGAGKVSDNLETHRDDMLYIETVISHIRAQGTVDPNRIFATGISRGGQAVFFLTCNRPDLVRAVAPVAMSLPEFMRGICKTVSNKGILMINGTADPIVPFVGGQIKLFKTERGAVLSTNGTMKLFAEMNGCSDATIQTNIGAVTVSEWQACHAPTILYHVNGGGHSWPGGRSFLPKRIVGPTNNDIDAADEIWKFFSRF